MRLRLGIPAGIGRADLARALDSALEAMTASQVPLVRARVVPTARAAIARGVRWRPEPPGDEHFDGARTVMRRGWGDCDDLAPWHAASLRATGEDPDARARVVPSGPGRWHAIVERGDGSIDDPSRWAGMRSSRVSGAAIWPPLAGDRMAIAAHPWRGRWAARVDVPDTAAPYAWSVVDVAPTRAAAVTGAIAGVREAIACAGEPDPDDEYRLAALAGVLEGARTDELVGALGEDVIGFLPALAPAALSLAAPLAKKLPIVRDVLPGGSAPARAPGAPAVPATAPPGTAMALPGGVYFVRF